MSAGIVKASNSKEVFERQAHICKAFAHPARLQILDLVGSDEQGISTLQEVLVFPKGPEVKQACELIRKVLEAQIAQSQRLIE